MNVRLVLANTATGRTSRTVVDALNTYAPGTAAVLRGLRGRFGVVCGRFCAAVANTRSASFTASEFLVETNH